MFITYCFILTVTLTPQTPPTRPAQKLNIDTLLLARKQLEQTLRGHYIQATHALIEEFNYQEQGKPIKYLPSIGYNFITQTPHLTYNTATLYAALNDQNMKKAKIQSIKKYMEVTFQAALEKLYRHYADLEIEIDYYNHALELYQLNQELFNIRAEQYRNLETTPSEFIASQIKIKSEEIKLKKKYTAILKLRNLILDIAKANVKPPLFPE